MVCLHVVASDLSYVLTSKAGSNVVADWAFEEGILGSVPTLIRDSSGNDRHSSRIFGRPVYIGSSNQFSSVVLYLPLGDSYGSGFVVEDQPAFALTNEFTLEVKMLPGSENQGLTRPVITLGSATSASFSYALHYYGDSQDRRILFWVSDQANHNAVLQAAYPQDNAFHHVAAVYQQGGLKIYIDGNLLSTTNSQVQLRDQPMPSLRVGTDEKGEITFYGALDRVRVTKKALSPEMFFNQEESQNDGIPASWRARYFGTNCVLEICSAIADPDQDGAINYREYLDGTDPTNSASVNQRPYAVDPFLGSVEGGQDGPRAEATFTHPASLRYDALGRLWITELTLPGFDYATGPQRVRMLDTNGLVMTVAGTNQPGYADGQGTEARFRGSQDLAIARSGEVFLTDRVNYRIRRIDTNGYVSTFVGSGRGYRDGVGNNAQFSSVIGIDIDADDNLYVADFENGKVRKVTPAGVVSTVASVQGAHDVALDRDGSLYMASWSDGAVYKLNPEGKMSVFASGLSYTEIVETDRQGHIYVNVPGYNPGLLCYSTNGTMLWKVHFNNSLDQNYLASNPAVGHVGTMQFLASGDILFSDGPNHRLRILRVGPAPLITLTLEPLATQDYFLHIRTPINGAIIRYTLDGSEPTLNSTIFTQPIAWNPTYRAKAQAFLNGHPVSEVGSIGSTNEPIYTPINDGISAAWRARYFGTNCPLETCGALADPDQDGAINYREYLDDTDPTSSASVKIRPYAVDPFLGSVEGDKDGPRSEATFNHPASPRYDALGRLWITEITATGFDSVIGPQRVRLLDTNGWVWTIAGTNEPGYMDGQGIASRFRGAQDLAIASSGDVFLTDRVNYRIRRIGTNGYVSTFAGSERGYRDGVGTNAQFSTVIGIDIDSADNLYVADFHNGKVRKVTPSGVVSTVASIQGVSDVAIDRDGTLYMAGWSDGAVYRMNSTGQISLFASGLTYTEVVEADRQGHIYSTIPGAVPALHCYSTNGVLLWRVQFRPGQDYLASTPDVGHVGMMQFLAGGDVLFADAINHQLRILRVGPAPLVNFNLETSTSGSLLSISTPINGGSIHFTLDGSEPSLNSQTYGLPILWNTAYQVKARVFMNEYAVSEIRSFEHDPADPAPELTAQRELPDFYQPGQNMVVSISVKPSTSAIVYAIEDQPPVGWTVEQMSQGGVWDPINHKVKFGPFFDNTPRALTYETKPPLNATSSMEFIGMAVENDHQITIGGDTQISPALQHPADNDPPDWRLTIKEVTSYASAWRTGSSWPVPPNRIPISYVTRATLLWKGGEEYQFSGSVDILPLAWINTPRAGQMTGQTLSLQMIQERSAVSELTTLFTPGKNLPVTLVITPSSSAQSYAVEEELPAGWKAENVSDSGYFDGQKVRWGPFFDNSPRSLRYQAVPAETTTELATFRGVASFDGEDVVISGQRQTSFYKLILASNSELSGGFSWELQSSPGVIFEVEFSQDLKAWTPLKSITNDTDVIIFRDTASPFFNKGFYKLTPRLPGK